MSYINWLFSKLGFVRESKYKPYTVAFNKGAMCLGYMESEFYIKQKIKDLMVEELFDLIKEDDKEYKLEIYIKQK